jgi:alkanesulfonate monooxygenase SsuD/methylene tetrahydromethanopterin reductase-like flavin-dependent oxidoreductase (luciferase family)
MEAGVHLPLIDFGGEGLSHRRLAETVDTARECGFTAVSALDVLSGGRVVAGLGPGSSRADFEAAGVPFEQRWQRFDVAFALIRDMLQPGSTSGEPGGLLPSPRQGRGIPLWVGSWGSPAGLRRVARLGDGLLASAYNTTPEKFAAGTDILGGELERRGRSSGGFPNALVTMWTWITGSRSETDRALSGTLAPLVGRDPAQLDGRVCVGSAGECAQLLSRYARAGCQLISFWPLGDERRQIELLAFEVLPQVAG